jgi:hypothetical protein
LRVVERFWRNIAKEDCVKISQVHAQFKGGGTTQDMNLALPEFSLKFSGFFLVELRRVFFHAKRAWQVRLVKEAIMVGFQISGSDFLENPRAAVP